MAVCVPVTKNLSLSFDARKHIFRFLKRRIFGQENTVPFFQSCLGFELLILPFSHLILMLESMFLDFWKD